MRKCAIIISSVVVAVVVAAGLGVLIWWLVTDNESDTNNRFETIVLEGQGFNNVEHRAAFTRIPETGDMFWMFYPTLAQGGTSRPIVLWLDGVVGTPPSLLANFGMFGPTDLNLNERTDSWINEYNLLFIDAPLGTGFSTVNGEISNNLSVTQEHLLLTLESFYAQNEAYNNTPLYIFGQGYGAQLALSLAQRLSEDSEFINPNLQGVVLGNAIISPTVALSRLGFYLEELGYIDANGRNAIEAMSTETSQLVNAGQLAAAFNSFQNLNRFVNDNAGAVAVNLAYIVEKLYNDDAVNFGEREHVKQATGFNSDFDIFMTETVGPAIGITNATYNSVDVAQSFANTFMTPAVDKVEYLLRNTNISVAIYNGNLDAVSNTPGQLEWVNNLEWPGQTAFLNSIRRTLVIDSTVEGYFRETERLAFYWINVAGLTTPLDNPAAMRRIIRRIMDE